MDELTASAVCVDEATAVAIPGEVGGRAGRSGTPETGAETAAIAVETTGGVAVRIAALEAAGVAAVLLNHGTATPSNIFLGFRGCASETTAAETSMTSCPSWEMVLLVGV